MGSSHLQDGGRTRTHVNGVRTGEAFAHPHASAWTSTWGCNYNNCREQHDGRYLDQNSHKVLAVAANII